MFLDGTRWYSGYAPPNKNGWSASTPCVSFTGSVFCSMPVANVPPEIPVLEMIGPRAGGGRWQEAAVYRQWS